MACRGYIHPGVFVQEVPMPKIQTIEELDRYFVGKPMTPQTVATYERMRNDLRQGQIAQGLVINMDEDRMTDPVQGIFGLRFDRNRMLHKMEARMGAYVPIQHVDHYDLNEFLDHQKDRICSGLGLTTPTMRKGDIRLRKWG